MSPTPPSLDHLILFLPLDTTTSKPEVPASISDAFALTPGGTHADNLTTNTLILLADGCYIELISFLSPDIANHWWGPDVKREGWTDWCLTTASPANENFASSLKDNESHVSPRAGARLRPDGVQVKWFVTFPTGDNGGQDKRGLVPFFCHDDPTSARNLRVPLDAQKTSHASGVLGVLSLTVLVDTPQSFNATREIYRGVFGNKGTSVGENQVVFQVERVSEVEGLSGRKSRVILRLAKDEEGEREKVQGRGYWFGDVVLGAKAGEERKLGERVKLDGEGVGGLWVEYV